MTHSNAVLLIVGARPQFVKAAPLMGRALPGASWVLVHTGQHYDYEMSAAFFEELRIPEPAYNLDVGPLSPAAQLARMTGRIAEVIEKENPAAVAVVGDTNSTLAGALAASCADVPLAHVEAGMRSYDWDMPEERNRVLADRLSGLRLCPHEAAAENLRGEGLTGGVAVVGDLMYEVAAAAYPALDAATYVEPRGLVPGDYAYVTCHRQENVDKADRLAAVVDAILRLDMPAYFPVHPRTARALAAAGLEERLAASADVRLAEPATYYASLALIRHAALVVTDSGGVQREAYLYDVPTLTLRDRTEWPETVEDGVNRLVDADPLAAAHGAAAALAREGDPRPRFELVGEPVPSVRITEALAAFIMANN
ncbi:MAG: UDP-N-acetylglucosamine 2-epimerase (non-hydrolyzing) [Candidatus Zixiibacteriota bacterium]|jgi:UDP-N-acetylglucosamine 2-epimerase (non-hydrolysing)